MRFIRAFFAITIIFILWTSTYSINSNTLYNTKINIFGEYIEDFKRKQKILKKSYKCSNTKYLYDINVAEKNLLLRLILYIIGFYYIRKSEKVNKLMMCN